MGVDLRPVEHKFHKFHKLDGGGGGGGGGNKTFIFLKNKRTVLWQFSKGKTNLGWNYGKRMLLVIS